MSQNYDSGIRAFVAGAAIAKNIRVKLSAGKLAVAGVADDWIGTTTEAAFADGDVIAVRLRTKEGTTKFVSANAIASGVRVYAAASGKIDDVVTTELVGVSLEAASGSDEVIEVLPLNNGQAFRMAKGEATLDGSNPTPVATGLNTITAAVAILKATAAPGSGDGLHAISVDYSGSDGTLNLYGWAATSGTDPTLIASTDSTAVIAWVAFGT